MVDWTDESAAATFLRAQGVETDLTDAALHAKALAAVQAIAARGYGPQTGVVLDQWVAGRGLISLAPPATTITTVTEEGVELNVDDDGYRVRPGGLFLERLSSGYPVFWNGRVVVTYDGAPASERYDGVVVDLVKLSLEFSGLDARRDGDYSEEAAGARSGGQRGYQEQREAIISELAPAWSFA